MAKKNTEGAADKSVATLETPVIIAGKENEYIPEVLKHISAKDKDVNYLTQSLYEQVERLSVRNAELIAENKSLKDDKKTLVVTADSLGRPTGHSYRNFTNDELSKLATSALVKEIEELTFDLNEYQKRENNKIVELRIERNNLKHELKESRNELFIVKKEHSNKIEDLTVKRNDERLRLEEKHKMEMRNHLSKIENNNRLLSADLKEFMELNSSSYRRFMHSTRIKELRINISEHKGISFSGTGNS